LQISTTKSYRLTSKYANKRKVELTYALFDEAKRIRNEMSAFCFENIEKLMKSLTYDFSLNYQRWKSELLPAHTVQTLLLDVIKFYKNHVKQLIQNITGKVRIQEKFVKERFKRGEKKGQIKSIDIKFKKTMLTKFVTYLIKAFKIETVTEKKIEEFFFEKGSENFRRLFFSWWESKDEEFKERVISLVNRKIKRVRKRIKLIQFSTGTFRLTNSGYSYEIVKDEENSRFKYFLKLKLKKDSVYLPLLVNEDYFNPEEFFSGVLSKQLLLIDRREKTNSRKLVFAVAKEEKLTFKEYGKALGVDVNLTAEKFLVSSDGIYTEIEREVVKELLSYLTKLDENGYQNITVKEKKKLQKLIRKVSWYIDCKIAEFIKKCKEEGITDIVLEDLRPFTGKRREIELFGYRLKANRFLRLLHLAGLKERFIQIAHNRGIRVHLTHAGYSSQQCLKCGSIDKSNRPSQSLFICRECGFEEEADRKSAVTLLLRFLYEPYRRILHTVNEVGELRPNKISLKTLKHLLIKHFNPENVSQVLESFSSSSFSPECPAECSLVEHSGCL
jgi:putative transposase